MSRFLHRPMFRRGGSTGEGITSGLRQGYKRGRVVNPGGYQGDEEFNLNEYITEAPELPKSSAGADFWLNLGTNILAQPGGKPILQTLGTAGKEPIARYQQQRSQEDLLKYKHAQGERQFQLEIYKAMSDEDKIALQKEIEYLMNEHGISKEEALNLAMPKYRKPRHPDEQELLDTEYDRDKIDAATVRTQTLLSKEGLSISTKQAEKINIFYDQADEQGWRYEFDQPFIDLVAIEEEWRGMDKKQEDWIDEGGNIAISPDEQITYSEGLYYVDSFTGDVYQVGPGSTELIKIDLSEIKIN
jgi:uncharacterized protein YkuJ